MKLFKLNGQEPVIGKDVFIASGARLIGQVTLEDNVNIWYNAVLRADINSISVGKNSNIQDNVTCHVDFPPDALVIGADVTVGHNVVLHGCVIGDNSLIGMGATVLSGAKIGKNCVVGANALVLENQVIPDNSLAVGMPAKVLRELSDEEINKLRSSAEHYVETAREYINEGY